MTKASDNEYPSVLFEEQAGAPTTPASGFWRIFTKSDGLYIVDDAGTVTGPFGTGGGGSAVANGARTVLTGGDYSGLSSTTFADLDATNAKLTLTTGAHSCLIGVTANASTDSSSVFIALDIDIDGTRQGQTDGLVIASGNGVSAENASFVYMTAALSAASHTFKIKYKIGTAGHTGQVYASTGVSPLVFWVEELQF